MRFPGTRSVIALLFGLTVASCSETANTPPVTQRAPLATEHLMAAPAVVISQIYGGGGNSGATLQNDFIELHNTSSTAASLAGWSVQYASAAGTSWQVTTLSGSIAAGGYYLVQESQGAGGTTALPAPDATGTIAMSATAGKVAVVSSTTALSGACSGGAIDQVSFGTTASDCGAKTTATLTNTTAAFRGDGGCSYTGDLSADFTTGAPLPRNSASPVHLCPNTVPVGALDHVLVAGALTVTPGGTTQLTATPQDINNQTVTTATTTWSTSDPTIATVDATGKVTGVVASATAVTITATSVDNGITKTASVQVTVATPGINWIDISSSSTSFPPGFQTQLFATARVSDGGTIIPATFTFEAVDPTIATVVTVENTGLVTGVAPPPDGTTRPGFRVTATPTGGGTPYVFITHPITIEAPMPAPLSIYARNDEFGDPTAASTSNPNDFLIVRPQYTISYNESRGTPNWVSYELDARQMVAGQDRCNCFTAEPTIPAAEQIFTSDYTNGGFDRGHMARSADRTAGNVDNAETFLLSNVVPQTADLNEGVWAQFEDAIADSAEAGRAVYIIVGPLFSASHGLSFLKGEGKVAIPDSTWKVALIGPRVSGVPFTLASIHTWSDIDSLTLLAVNMPNVAGVRNDPWQKYLTTVDRIEASTGQNYLSLLPAMFQVALEAGDRPPVPQFTHGTGNEGAPISFDASTSTDPDLGRTDLGRTEALTYSWTFGDGGQASGKTVTHTFRTDGTFTATLTVTDAFGWPASTSQSVVVNNVAPTVAIVPASLPVILSGGTFAVTGSFTDPGADSPWHAVIDWGNGTTTPSTVTTAGARITGSSTYLVAGTHAVTLSVTDRDGATGSRSLDVVVARRPVLGDAEPKLLSIARPGSGDIVITLYSDKQVDVTTLDLTTVRIGPLAGSEKSVKVTAEVNGTSSIALHFAKADLIAAGAVTTKTLLLNVIGTVASGMQIGAPVLFVAR